MAVEVRQWRLTAGDFERMAEVGILSEDDRVELIDGKLYEMSPIGSRHAGCVNRASELLRTAVGRRGLVAVQNPIRLGDHSEPQPDIAVLRPRADFYANAHLTADSVLLLIEVADTSLEHDHAVKLPEYARAGVPEVWLVDLAGERVIAHTDPAPAGYRVVHFHRRGQFIRPAAFPEVSLVVTDILG